jgi:BON domain
MKRAEFRFRLCILVLLLTAGGCTIKQSQSPAPPSDQVITSDIQAKLFQDPVLKTRDINVSAQNAIVTLTGSVNSDDEKTSVERIANQEKGLKLVVDQLVVANAVAAAPAQTPAAPTSETARTSRKKRHQRGEASAANGAVPAASVPASTQAQNAAPTPAPVVDQPPPAEAPAAAPAAPPTLTIPAGTTVTVRTIDPVDSSTSQPGQEFAATLAAPIVVGNRVAVPAGSDATVRLVNASSSGRFEGTAQLALELHSLTINGSPHRVRSSTYQQSGGSRGRSTAEKVGGGAVIGGLIGAIAGGGKGAAIGAGIGGAGGGGVQAASKRGQVKIPSETKIDFVLRAPISVTLSQ